MGCKLSRENSSEDDCTEQPINFDGNGKNFQLEGCDNADGRRTKNEGISADQKTAKKNQNKKKKKKNDNCASPGAVMVGSKLAISNQEGVQSSPVSNGGLSGEIGNTTLSISSAYNGSISGAQNAGSSPISHDKLHKNFQERLITSQLSRNGQKLTDSQLEFFRMLDEKIDQGKDYDSGVSR